jgi:hypothetical protein
MVGHLAKSTGASKIPAAVDARILYGGFVHHLIDRKITSSLSTHGYAIATDGGGFG